MKTLKLAMLLLWMGLFCIACTDSEKDIPTEEPSAPTPVLTAVPADDNSVSDSESSEAGDSFKRAEERAKEAAANAKKIASGNIYESITSIHKNSKIWEMDSSYTVFLNLKEDSPDKVAKNFYTICKKILRKTFREKQSVSFALDVGDEKFITNFVVTYSDNQLIGIEPDTAIKKYESALKKAYKADKYFQNIDIDKVYDLL